MSTVASTSDPLLQVKGICHDFTRDGLDYTALEDISFDIAEGELTVLLGPSGCGKSTMLNIIGGFLKPSGGSLLLGGKETSKPGADRGVVFQGYNLLPWKTALENVTLGPRISKKFNKREVREKALESLDLVGLLDSADVYPHQLSGGMQQRVAVARALANEPALLLMDEPFAAVDAQTRERLAEELLGIWAKKESMTVVFVTHSIEEAAFLASQLIVFSSAPGSVFHNTVYNRDRPNRWADARSDPAFNQRVADIARTVRDATNVGVELSEARA